MGVRYVWSKNQEKISYVFEESNRYYLPDYSSNRIKVGVKDKGEKNDMYVVLFQSMPTLESAGRAKYTGKYGILDGNNDRDYYTSEYPYAAIIGNASFDSDAIKSDGFPQYPSSGEVYNGTVYLDNSWVTTSSYQLIYYAKSSNGSRTERWYAVKQPSSGSDGPYFNLSFAGTKPGNYIFEYDSNRRTSKGEFVSWVSSASPSAYPNYGSSGGYFYEAETQDVIDPSGITISGSVVPGADVDVVVTPSSSAQRNSYGKISYNYEYQYDDSGGWKSAGSSSEVSFRITIESGHVSIKARVKAKDDIGFESSDYVESVSFPISALADLIISNYEYGEDGNIGKVLKDIEFYISEEGSSKYRVSVYNGQFVYTFEADSNAKYYVNILDLIVGEGRELKFVFISAAGASSEKTFVYTKDAQVFPSVNVDIGILKNGDKDSYPMTVSEAVRTQGGVTLDVLLSNLMEQINELTKNPAVDYRERNLIMNYSDPNGSKAFTRDIGFTAYEGSVFAMLLDFDFSGSNSANFICIGSTPESWNNNCIRFYVADSDTDGFTMHIFSSDTTNVRIDGDISGHHKLVVKCKCQSTNTVSVWFDGKKVLSDTGSAFHAGSWTMSNAEGSNRFKGTYNEISILKPYLTDEQYLEASKVG